MNINEKQKALIEKYLDNNLSSIQKNAFEEELKSEDFRKQLMFQAQLIDAHRSVEKDQILNELDSFAQANKKEEKNKKYLGFLIGIVVAGLIIFTLLFTMKEDKPVEALYAQYLIQLPADVNTRGENNTQNEIYQSSMQAYVKGDYDDAITGFKKVLPKTAMTDLYVAMCYLNNGDVEKAEQELRPLLICNDEKVVENAQYYKALILVKQSNFKEAKKLLHKISLKENHLFKVKAKELIGKLADF